jgi:citrate synthase
MELKNASKYGKDYWRTKISSVRRNEILIRGYPLGELVGQISFIDAILLCMAGELPSEKEAAIVNAVFTSAMDHQFINATALAGRVVVSANPDPMAGIAAAILCFGRVTAGVPGIVCELVNSAWSLVEKGEAPDAVAKRVFKERRAAGERLPGIGHPVHDTDERGFTFRSRLLYDKVAELGLPMDRKLALYLAIRKEAVAATGKDLPVNVDGVIGAVFAELGYSPLQSHCLSIFTMLPGIVAHVIEEIEDGVPLRVAPESEYIGPPLRHRGKA